MTTLLIVTLAVAANVSLVVFVANLSSRGAVATEAEQAIVTSNENGFASARKLAA